MFFIAKNNIIEEYENHSITLRKKKLNEMLMNKRISSCFVSSLSYQIRPETLKLSFSSNNYIDDIIRHKFKVEYILHDLFGEEIPKLKYALYLLRNYIIAEIDSKQKENYYLTENNEELINLLCSLLLFPDNQIKYEVLWCVMNLTDFSSEIEKYIYSYPNLEKIYESLALRDNILFTLLIDLIRNCCTTEDRNRIFFLNKDILRDLCDIYMDESTIDDVKIKILKCVSMLSKILISMTNYCIQFKEIIKLLKPILLKKDSTTSTIYFVFVLLKNITSSYNELFNVLLTEDFAKDLCDLYYSNPCNSKIKWLIIIINFSSGSDQHKQLLIDKGILNILKEALNEYQFNSNKMLSHAILGITNIANGTISQIEQLWNNGIMTALSDISKRVYDELQIQSLHKDNSILFANILYAFCNCISGSSDEVQTKFIEYEKGIILKMIMHGLKEFKNNHLLIWHLLKSIEECILFEKNNMSDISIRALLLEQNIEDILYNICINSPIESIQVLSQEIHELIKLENES